MPTVMPTPLFTESPWIVWPETALSPDRELDPTGATHWSPLISIILASQYIRRHSRMVIMGPGVWNWVWSLALLFKFGQIILLLL